LSDETVHYRYGGLMNLRSRVAHDRLIRSCFVDFDRQIALVAVHRKPGGDEEIVGVARLLKSTDDAEAEFAVVIADAWQGRGIGTRLLALLPNVARAEGLGRVSGTIFSGNAAMLKACDRAGFHVIPQVRDACGDWTAQMLLA
jgi:acetyltransferase